MYIAFGPILQEAICIRVSFSKANGNFKKLDIKKSESIQLVVWVMFKWYSSLKCVTSSRPNDVYMYQ